MNAEEKDLLHRHLNGDLDAAEQAAFLAKLQASPELRRELASLAMDEMLISELVLEGRTAAKPHRRPRTWLPGAIAAALLLGLSLLLSLGRGASTGFRVVAAGGNAALQRGNATRGLEPGMELREGDQVFTASGSASLEKSGTLVELRDNATVVFREGGRLRLESGVVNGRGEGLVILSKYGTTQVRRGAARLDATPERLRVEAEEGSIVFEPDGEKPVEIAAGRYVRFGALEKVTTGRIVSRPKVDDAVRRGAAFLLAHRADLVLTITSEKRNGPAPRRTYAELALLALHRAGVPRTDPVMVELIGLVRGRPLESIYSAALQAMALAEIDFDAHRERIHQCAQFLVDSQCANGQWDYGAKIALGDVHTGPVRRRSEGPPSGDNSVSSYAALGLHACAARGIDIDRDVVDRAAKWWLRCQNADGGWGYNDSGNRSTNDAARRTDTSNTSYGSATASALAALVALQRMQGRDPRLPEIRKGEQWLAANFAVDRNPGKDPGFVQVQWLYAAAKAGQLLATERFGAHDWYPDGADFLLQHQRPTGEWRVEHGEFLKSERADVIDTCMAILFLRSAP